MAGNMRVTHEYSPATDSSSNIKVFVRGRPPEDKGEKLDSFGLFGEGNDPDSDIYKKIVIKDPAMGGGSHGNNRSDVSFSFDRIFWVKDTNEDVFNVMCKQQIDHVLNGFNSCCFAYGQTGSGKTYTMFGEQGGVTIEGVSRGMIPRSVEYLFSQIGRKAATSDCAVVCSFLEIYCDQIRDLGKAYLVSMGAEEGSSAVNVKTSELFETIAAKRGNPYFAPAFNMRRSESQEKMPGIKDVTNEYKTMNYEIREDAEGNVFVKDLSLVPVSTLEEVKKFITQGLAVRATHETKMNATSSRSHTVFTVTVVMQDKGSGQSTQGILNLVDLAGCERLQKSESEGQRLKEALHINTSLTALGKVIVSLDPSSGYSHVPYRDAKLTRILQNSLGGNSYTTVIAAMHPSASYYEECLSTLHFANRCRNVVNNPRVNYVGEDDKENQIKRLTQEITALRMKLGGGGMMLGADGIPVPTSALPPEIIAEILQRFGIDAVVNANGELLVDGAVVNPADVLAGDGAGDGAFAARGRRGLGGGVSSSLLRESEVGFSEMKSQLKALKKEKDVLGKQFESQGAQLVKAQTMLKTMETTLQRAVEDKSVSLEEQGQQIRKHYSAMLKSVKETNEEIVANQLALINAVPENLKHFMEDRRKEEAHRELDTAPLKAYYEREIAVMRRNASDVLENFKVQYQHFLDVKDDQIRSFVAQFNDYREKKARQVRKVEVELVQLYKHTQELEGVLRDVASGSFPVRQKQGTQGKTTTGLATMFVAPTLTTRAGTVQVPAGTGGVGAGTGTGLTAVAAAGEYTMQPPKDGGVLLPKGLRPPNAVHKANLRINAGSKDEFRLTQRIVKRYAMKDDEDMAKKEALYQEALYKAEQVHGMFGLEDIQNEEMNQNIRAFIFETKDAKARATSAGVMRPPVHKPHYQVRPSTAGLSRAGIAKVLDKSDREAQPVHTIKAFAEQQQQRAVQGTHHVVHAAPVAIGEEMESVISTGDAESVSVTMAAPSINAVLQEPLSPSEIVGGVQHASADGAVVGVSESSKTVQFLSSETIASAGGMTIGAGGMTMGAGGMTIGAGGGGSVELLPGAGVASPSAAAVAEMQTQVQAPPTDLEDTSVVRSLRAKVNELQGVAHQTTLNNTMVVESLGGDETLQYIVALEDERRRLGEQNRDLNAQLRSSKVAIASLKRRMEKSTRGMGHRSRGPESPKR